MMQPLTFITVGIISSPIPSMFSETKIFGPKFFSGQLKNIEKLSNNNQVKLNSDSHGYTSWISQLIFVVVRSFQLPPQRYWNKSLKYGKLVKDNGKSSMSKLVVEKWLIIGDRNGYCNAAVTLPKFWYQVWVDSNMYFYLWLGFNKGNY